MAPNTGFVKFIIANILARKLNLSTKNTPVGGLFESDRLPAPV
jgi:hypothetical protein